MWKFKPVIFGQIHAAGDTAIRVKVECLRCGHCGVLDETDLPRFGVESGAPIATFVKRLTCHSTRPPLARSSGQSAPVSLAGARRSGSPRVSMPHPARATSSANPEVSFKNIFKNTL
jgi:hypothetical protein